MKRKSPLLAALLSLLVLCSCGYETTQAQSGADSNHVGHPGDVSAGSQQNRADGNGEDGLPNNTGIAGGLDMGECRVTELYQKDVSSIGIQRIWAYFLVPIDFTQEEAIAHAGDYVESAIIMHPGIVVVILSYYDDEIYYLYRDSPVAEIQWSPRGGYNNIYRIPAGDYSTHRFDCQFYDYFEENELDQEERRLYEAMQTYSQEHFGKLVAKSYHKELMARRPDDMAVFEAISGQNDVPIEYLMDIIIKVSSRREPEMYDFFDSYEDDYDDPG